MISNENISKEYALEVGMFLAVIAWMDEDLDDREVDYIYKMVESFGELTEFEIWKIKYQLAYPHHEEELINRLNYLVNKTKFNRERKFALGTLEEFISIDGKVWENEQKVYDMLLDQFYQK
jgi:hypothetical protein